MGAGKTSAAIAKMSEETDKRFIFLTQMLPETHRIRNACAGRDFFIPTYGESGGGKLASLHELLKQGRNVSTTHALFYRYTDETLDCIKRGNYCLVLDEVIDIVKFLEVTPDDIVSLLDSGLIQIEPDTNRVVWAKDGYRGRWSDIKQEVDTSCVTYEDGKLFVWMMPIEMFSSFSEVLILTYMFKAQYQYYYYLLHGIEIEYIGVVKGEQGYHFTRDVPDHHIHLPPIHVCDDESLNNVGDRYYSLSSTWHKNEHGKTTDAIEQLKNKVRNYFIHKTKSKSENRLWATFESTEDKLKGKGFTKRHLAYNTRATNDYANCTHLAYLVNVFPHVDTQIYFTKRGFEIDSDAIATSTLVQWLWRSRLRNGEEVWLYLPSKRMRDLLQKWIEEVNAE